ncbi:hypothetical protein D3C73_1419130 [compost metagenome]
MEHVQRTPGGGQIVEVLQVAHRHPPQLPAPVVLVDQRRTPAVFVKKQHALGIDMPRACLERAFHHPHPVQLITGVLRVEVPGLEQVGVLHLRA